MAEIITRRRGRELGRLRDQRGISTVEYIIVLVLLSLVTIAGWTVFGKRVKCALQRADGRIATLSDAEAGGDSEGCPSGSGSDSAGDSDSASDSDPGGGSDSPAPQRPKRVSQQ